MGSYRARGALATLALASVVLVAVIAAGTISMQPLLPNKSPNTPTSQTQDSRQVIVVKPPAERPSEGQPGEDPGSTGDREVAGDEELIPVPDVLIPLDPILRPVPPDDDPGTQPGDPTDPSVVPTDPTVDPTDPVVDPDPTPTPPPRGGNGGVITPEPTKGNTKGPKPAKGPKVKIRKPKVVPAQPAIPGVRPAIPSSRASAKAQRSTSRSFSSSPVVVIHTPKGNAYGHVGKSPAKRVQHSSAKHHAPKRSSRGDSDDRREKHKATNRGRGHRRGHRRRPHVTD